MANKSSIVPSVAVSRTGLAVSGVGHGMRLLSESREDDSRRQQLRIAQAGNELGPRLREAPDASRTVLVAIDASASADRVLSSGIRMLHGMASGTLHVLHVFRATRYDHARAGVPAVPAEVIAAAKEERLETHVRAARRECRAQVVGHFVLGDPATEVLRLCAELDADLLVVGTHDRYGLGRLLIGSMTETFVRKAPCAVLVVRQARGSL